MGHNISGIIAPIDELRKFSDSNNLHAPSQLRFGLGFLPLSDSHLDYLYPVHGSFLEPMRYLSEALIDGLKELSRSCKVAYVETDYFGGQGSQGAVVYDEGECVYGPVENDERPISDALKLLGVERREDEHDEFEAVGLCQYRDNDDWIESKGAIEDKSITGSDRPDANEKVYSNSKLWLYRIVLPLACVGLAMWNGHSLLGALGVLLVTMMGVVVTAALPIMIGSALIPILSLYGIKLSSTDEGLMDFSKPANNFSLKLSCVLVSVIALIVARKVMPVW